MTAVRRKRLILVLSIVFGVALAIGLALYALNQNLNLFYSPTQVDDGQAPINHLIRVGGIVKEHSFVQEANSVNVKFVLTDKKNDVTVNYAGVLPNLFREGQGIVCLGQALPNHTFKATQVLAKHDNKYMPPEVAKILGKGVVKT